MADPLWLPDVLRAAGLEVREHPGWRDRGHGDFGAIWGVVAHHTGSNPPSNNPAYIAQHPSLGLASQLHLSRDGVYTVCGAGIAWHAGAGSYPGIPANNANACTIGIEAENNGREGWGKPQYDAYVRGVAAILTKLGKGAANVIGHKEWAGPSQGKWDPGGMDMNKFRADVAGAMKGQPPQRGEGTVWGEMFKNFKGTQVSYATAVYYIDKLVNDIADQVTRGWKQLGLNEKGEPLTLVDAVAELRSDVAEIKRLLAERES
ncbi:peptidoglycan recognition protein family protein [Nocardia puris]|uniref:N-acetylmuramoyl-L-alanine amidase n=1 Tax=Nocardia puris TaxID=208602 RepID=A0A366CW49_9NOCA|nr:N-acetylmuramoyl-L-alanine amidase [Nocardia puris]RBO82061.1 N-acetylmuramoyl-L-alanine amidase [Nocardia puris]